MGIGRVPSGPGGHPRTLESRVPPPTIDSQSDPQPPYTLVLIILRSGFSPPSRLLSPANLCCCLTLVPQFSSPCSFVSGLCSTVLSALLIFVDPFVIVWELLSSYPTETFLGLSCISSIVTISSSLMFACSVLRYATSPPSSFFVLVSAGICFSQAPPLLFSFGQFALFVTSVLDLFVLCL